MKFSSDYFNTYFKIAISDLRTTVKAMYGGNVDISSVEVNDITRVNEDCLKVVLDCYVRGAVDGVTFSQAVSHEFRIESK